MAIQLRRGIYNKFQPDKMLAGEIAVVLSGDPGANDGKTFYICFEPGNVKHIMTYEDLTREIELATADILVTVYAAGERAETAAVKAEQITATATETYNTIAQLYEKFKNTDVAQLSDKIDEKAPINHKSTATTYGVGDESNYGHVKLSDSVTNTSGVAGGAAATPKAVKSAYDLANGKANKSHKHSASDITAGVLPAANVDLSGVVSKSGDTMTGTLTANFLISENSIYGQACELGSTTKAGTPIVDFHSSGKDTDFDSRIIATGGNSAAGQGTLHFVSIALTSDVSLTVTSDARDKTDIEPMDEALDFIKKLVPVTYLDNNRQKYIPFEKTDKDVENYNKYGMCDYDKKAHEKGILKGDRRQAGLIAQDVAKFLKETYQTDNYANIVNDSSSNFEEYPDNLENQLTMSYERLVPFLIKQCKS